MASRLIFAAICAALLSAPAAHAEPVAADRFLAEHRDEICLNLVSAPSPLTVQFVVNATRDHSGLSRQDSLWVVQQAINTTCPNAQPSMNAYLDGDRG